MRDPLDAAEVSIFYYFLGLMLCVVLEMSTTWPDGLPSREVHAGVAAGFHIWDQFALVLPIRDCCTA